MAPKGFDRFFLVVGAGRNRKFVRLTDSERCAHFLGILALAAQSPRRGYLLVHDGEEAGPEEIANEAGGAVTVKIASSAMEKLKRVGVLERDDHVGAWYVHDWHQVNPEPRPDPTNAERQKRHRNRHNSGSNADRNGESNADRNAPANSAVTASNAPEVEVEVRRPASQVKAMALRADVLECFAYWQDRCAHPTAKLTADREAKIKTRLREDYTVLDIRQGIDGAALHPYIDEKGKRFDDIELICRTGSKLEDFMGRANAPVVHIAAGRKPSAGDLIAKLQAAEEAS